MNIPHETSSEKLDRIIENINRIQRERDEALAKVKELEEENKRLKECLSHRM